MVGAFVQFWIYRGSDASPGHEVDIGETNVLARGHYGDIRANDALALTKDARPFLLQKGSRGCVIPIAQSQLLYQALKAAGVPMELDILDGAGHGDMPGEEPTS